MPLGLDRMKLLTLFAGLLAIVLIALTSPIYKTGLVNLTYGLSNGFPAIAGPYSCSALTLAHLS